MEPFYPTHRFTLHDGTTVDVAVELRGDYVGFEADGAVWSTNMGDMTTWWSSQKHKASTIAKVELLPNAHKIAIAKVAEDILRALKGQTSGLTRNRLSTLCGCSKAGHVLHHGKPLTHNEIMSLALQTLQDQSKVERTKDAAWVVVAKKTRKKR